MEYDQYLREQAIEYRQQSETVEDPRAKQELLELAAVCERVANRIEDRLPSG